MVKQRTNEGTGSRVNHAANSNVVDLQGLGMRAARMMSGMLGRSRLGRALTSFGGRRDYNSIFGWDPRISIEAIMYMYNRGGIAKRVIDAYPDAVWARSPTIWAEGDPEWNVEWTAIASKLKLWTHLHRLDKLTNLGRYAILVIGTDKPGLEMPLRDAKDITYLQPYGELSVKIESWVSDPTDPRFGKPAMYKVYPESNNDMLSIERGATGSAPTRPSFRVHASRVIHVTRNPLEDDVFGQPMMAPIWDYLTDLRKVVGSSSESYWIAANRGLQANVDREMSLSAEDQAALQEEIEEFYNGFRRFIRTKGVDLNELKNDIADPSSPFGVLVTLISGTWGIPQRILLGSEAGQLASTQDKGTWAERVEENRILHVEPSIIIPFLDFCLENGIIRAPNEGSLLKVDWPDAYRMSPLERGQTSAQTARVLSYIVKLMESKSEEAKTLLDRTEQRALLGLSTDNKILKDNPDP